MRTYHPSGAVPIFGALLTLVVGALAAAVLGVAYAYFINWVPLIYFNFCATAIFGGLVGGAIGGTGRVGKLRDPLLPVVFAVSCGALGLYVAWAFDPKARFGADYLAFDPTVLRDYMLVGYDAGFWSIGRLGQENQNNVSGVLLAAVWIVEGLAVMGTAGAVAHFSGKQPFCEGCQRWTETKEGVYTLENLTDADPRLDKLLEGDLSELASLPRPESLELNHLRLDLTTCPSCSESTFVSLTRVVMKKNDKGELETTKKELVTHLVVDPNQLPLLLEVIPPEPGSRPQRT